MLPEDPPPPAEAKMRAIGWIACPEYRVYEAPRQAVLAGDNRGWIHLYEDMGLEPALEGIDGFDRLWVVTLLHLKRTWRPKVAPPREGVGKIGMLATRSPHRPNRIGLSCVRLLGIEGQTLEIAEHDFLHRTPVLDIKPYLPYADSFPGASTGWLETYPLEIWRVEIDPGAEAGLTYLEEQAGLPVRSFLQAQLSTEPTASMRKRITEAPDGRWVIAYLTWRIRYEVGEQAGRVLGVSSGYRAEELADPDDPHEDKAIHRAFVAEHS